MLIFNSFRKGIPSSLSILNRSYCFVSTADVELTSVRYKGTVKRGDFSTLTDSDLGVFEGILGKDRILTDPSDLELHNLDWIRSVRGKKPHNTS